MTTENYWKDLYFREVEGLNNEGDPIGGDPPRGLKHIAQDYTELRCKINQLKNVCKAERVCHQHTGKWANVSDLLHLIEKL